MRNPKQVGWISWSYDVKKRIGSDGPSVDDMRHMLLAATYGRAGFQMDFSAKLEHFRKFLKKRLRNS